MPNEALIAWVMLIALAAYTLLGGADFGAGVWDLFASGPRKERQRDFLADAIGPVWEANHVWLILIIVLLFTCFPLAFAAAMTALHFPVTLVLLGIVARGASFAFRSYSPGAPAQARWGWIFSVASVITPLLLGVTMGTAASGKLHWENEVYVSGFFAPWLQLFPWAVGFFTLFIFAYLAAVYLCVEAKDEELREDFRKRALISGVLVAIAAAITWLLSYEGAPMVHGRLWWPLQVATAVTASVALAALYKNHFVLARALVVVQVLLIILGFGMAIFPFLVVPQFDVMNSAAAPMTLRLVLGALALGALLLFPSLYVLFRIFKGQRAFSVMDRDS